MRTKLSTCLCTVLHLILKLLKALIIENLIDEIYSLVQTMAVNEKVIPIGHSYGGALARAFAVEHADKVEV